MVTKFKEFWRKWWESFPWGHLKIVSGQSASLWRGQTRPQGSKAKEWTWTGFCFLVFILGQKCPEMNPGKLVSCVGHHFGHRDLVSEGERVRKRQCSLLISVEHWVRMRQEVPGDSQLFTGHQIKRFGSLPRESLKDEGRKRRLPGLSASYRDCAGEQKMFWKLLNF